MASTAKADTITYCNFDLEERFTCLMCTDKVVFDWIDLQRHCENVHFWYQNKKNPFFPKLVLAGLVSFIERRRCFTCRRCNHGIILDFDVDENVRILREHEQECRNSTADEERLIDAALEALERVSIPRRPMPMPPPPPKISGLDLQFPNLDGSFIELNEPGPSSSVALPFYPARQYSGSRMSVPDLNEPAFLSKSLPTVPIVQYPPVPLPRLIDVLNQTDQEIPGIDDFPIDMIDVESEMQESEPEPERSRPSRQRLRTSPSPLREKKHAKRNARISSRSSALSELRWEPNRKDESGSIPGPSKRTMTFQEIIDVSASPNSGSRGLEPPKVRGQETILEASDRDGKKLTVDFPGFTVEEVKNEPPPLKRRKTEARSYNSERIVAPPSSLVVRSRAASSGPSLSNDPVIPEVEVLDFSFARVRPKRASVIPPIKYTEGNSGFREQKTRNTTSLKLKAPVESEVGTKLQNLSSRNENKTCHGIRSRGNTGDDRRSRMELKKLMGRILDFTVNFKNKRGRQLSIDFQKLPSKKELPGYYERIEKPLDIKMLRANINSSKYCSVDELETDFKLLCKNAQTYNRKKSAFYVDSVTLQSVFAKARQMFEAEAAAEKE